MKKKNNGLFYLLFLPKYFRASHFMITLFYRNKCTLNHCGLNSWTELCMTQSHFISSLKLLYIITLNRYGKLIKNNYWWKYEQSIKNDLLVSPNSSECIWILMSDRDKQLTAESALLKWTCMSSVVMIVMPHVLMHTWSNYVNVNTSHAGTIHVVILRAATRSAIADVSKRKHKNTFYIVSNISRWTRTGHKQLRCNWSSTHNF